MRQKLLMNRDWLYYFGEPEYKLPKVTSSDQTYRGSRGENARGAARRDFYDADWRHINLPHDFVNENGPSPDYLAGEKHCYPSIGRGSAWYRRYFKLDEADKGKRITLLFDGTALRTEVYVNSMLLKTNRTAGIGYEVDITEVARYGTDLNVVSVHTDCNDYEAWYYEGGGIYRNVWLVKTDRLAVDLWGTFVHSKHLDGKNWEVTVETEVRNDYYVDKNAKVVSKIADPTGKIVAEFASEEELCTLQEVKTFVQKVTLEDPMLWGMKEAAKNIYKLYTEVVCDGEVVDTYETNFGIREIYYDKDKGMFLNGEKCIIYGFANHQIQVGMGNAMSDSMREFQMRTIADVGGNGFRTAHSPHGDATYDYCDKYGLLVMDENRVFHPSEIVQDEVKRLIKRDRNHPSVCMWSLYNEEDSVTDHTGKFIFQKLAATARKFDPTRPMSGATSYGMYTEGAHEKEYGYDLFGVNHQAPFFEGLHNEKPDLPLYCSEAVMPVGPQRPGRDIYPTGAVFHIFNEKPFVIGGFHFTAWAFGTGKPRVMACDGTYGPVAHGFKAILKQNEPYAKIPSWCFPGMEGKEIETMLPNNGEYVELYVNGKLAVKADTDMYAVTPVKVVYEPGEAKLVAYKDGKVWAEDVVNTPGEPAAIKLVLENLSVKADNDDVAIVSAYLVDKDGNWCDKATGYPTTFSSNCAGEYVGSVTQRLDGFMGWHDATMNFVYGKAQVFFRSMDVAGDLVITTENAELPVAEIAIKREATGAIPAVAEVPSNFVIDWQISKLMPGTVCAEKIIQERDIELWEHIDTQGSPDILYGARGNVFTGAMGLYPDDVDLNYAYYTKTTVPCLGKKADGQKLFLNFEGLDGIADVYIIGGGKKVKANHPEESPWGGHYRPQFYVDADVFAAGEEVEIWVIVYKATRVTGIGWPVRWDYKTQEEVDAWVAREKREWDYHNYKAFLKK